MVLLVPMSANISKVALVVVILYRERLRPCENPEHEDFGKFGRCISCIEGYFPKDEDEVTEE